MSCTSPLLALDYGIDSETGKHKIKILPKRADFNLDSLKERYGDMLLKLPCGKCDSCHMTKRKEWSLRCMLEASCYDDNSFLTLTYNDEHYPSNYKTDFQNFIKKLRDKTKEKIRYFGCCERGSKSGRFHLHIIIFGYSPEDLKVFTKNDGIYTYTSKEIESLWMKGFCTVGEVSADSCSYVAGYCSKKYYDRDNFILMSTRPGIGYQWYVLNKKNIHNYDSITFKDFKGAHIPRYFDKLDEKNPVDAFNLALRKDDRIKMSVININGEKSRYGYDREEDLLKANANKMKNKLTKKKRGL